MGPPAVERRGHVGLRVLRRRLLVGRSKEGKWLLPRDAGPAHPELGPAQGPLHRV